MHTTPTGFPNRATGLASRASLPWVTPTTHPTPKGVAQRMPRVAAGDLVGQPFQGCDVFAGHTQGRCSFLAPTLGFVRQPRWGCEPTPLAKQESTFPKKQTCRVDLEQVPNSFPPLWDNCVPNAPSLAPPPPSASALRGLTAHRERARPIPMANAIGYYEAAPLALRCT
jgi:hypothetical protein